MQGFVSKQESGKLRQCLLEISESHIPNLYSDNEKAMLGRCWLSCPGSRCVARCKNSRNFTQHDARDIYSVHARIPREKEPDHIVEVNKKVPTPQPKPKAKKWMTGGMGKESFF
jgi:hypothetical protein